MTGRNGQRFSRDVRREQVVQAALRVIAGKGVGGLTTVSIAKEAGISEANLYRHFKNKEEILSETVQSIGEGLMRNLDDAFRISSSPLPGLKRVFMFHLDYIERNGGIPRLMFSEEIHMGSEDLKKKLLEAIGSYATRIEKLVKEGQKTGEIRRELSPRAAAFTLIGMVQVTVMRWSLSGFSFPLVDEGMKLWENFRRCVSL